MHLTLADINEDFCRIKGSGKKALLVNVDHGFEIEAWSGLDSSYSELPQEDEIVCRKLEGKGKFCLEIKIVAAFCLEALIRWIENCFFPWEEESDLATVRITWSDGALIAERQ